MTLKTYNMTLKTYKKKNANKKGGTKKMRARRVAVAKGILGTAGVVGLSAFAYKNFRKRKGDAEDADESPGKESETEPAKKKSAAEKAAAAEKKAKEEAEKAKKEAEKAKKEADKDPFSAEAKEAKKKAEKAAEKAKEEAEKAKEKAEKAKKEAEKAKEEAEKEAKFKVWEKLAKQLILNTKKTFQGTNKECARFENEYIDPKDDTKLNPYLSAYHVLSQIKIGGKAYPVSDATQKNFTELFHKYFKSLIILINYFNEITIHLNDLSAILDMYARLGDDKLNANAKRIFRTCTEDVSEADQLQLRIYNAIDPTLVYNEISLFWGFNDNRHKYYNSKFDEENRIKSYPSIDKMLEVMKKEIKKIDQHFKQ